MNDTDALDAITPLMNGQEWSPDTLDGVAECWIDVPGRWIRKAIPVRHAAPGTIAPV